jgi:hypothetical protein
VKALPKGSAIDVTSFSNELIMELFIRLIFASFVKKSLGVKERKRYYLESENVCRYISVAHDLELFKLAEDDRCIKYLEEIVDLFNIEKSILRNLISLEKILRVLRKIRSPAKIIEKELIKGSEKSY